MDFTTATYRSLLRALQARTYTFQTVNAFFHEPKEKTIILRHDVDRQPVNALLMARLEHDTGIAATYYFRAVPESWDERVIREIASLGHEVGYHYENLAACSGDLEKAFADFKANLARLRELAPVSTACMHGSPLSRINNLDLLRRYDYKALGIVAEPYLDVDFDQVFYLTDTGRRWDGWKVSVRDKMFQQEKWVRQGLVFHGTRDIIRAVEAGRLPKRVMITIHPQRWDDRLGPWLKELILQNGKNFIKARKVHLRGKRETSISF